MRRAHRPIAILSALVIASSALVAVPAAAADPTPDEVAAAEQHLVDLINARRDRRDKRPFRVDSRVAALARAKSQDMIDHDYFSHVDGKGRVARDHLERADIRFTRVGEIIAWTHAGDPMEAADDALDLWMHSAVHKRQIMTDNNYLGAGIAHEGSTYKLTVIFITGPDRTKPTARFTETTRSGDSLRLAWTGSDPRLVVGTAGLKSFDVAERIGDGAWTTIRSKVTSRSLTRSVPEGSQRSYRVRARDKAGNIGAWTTVELPVNT